MTDTVVVYSNIINVVEISETELDLIIESNDSTIVLESEVIELLELVEQGLPGPQGAPGSTSGAAGVCGEDISIYQVLVLDNGLLYKADTSNPLHASLVVGVSTQSGLTGSTINYSSVGKINGGSFIIGKNFAGPSGSLTTIVPTTGWLKLIGLGESSSTFIVDMGPSIERS
jgi:hypothetical protein